MLGYKTHEERLAVMMFLFMLHEMIASEYQFRLLESIQGLPSQYGGFINGR
jgi:hypothetical protein